MTATDDPKESEGNFFLVPVAPVERVVVGVGLLIAHGTSTLVAVFASMMAVYGDGSATGVKVMGGVFFICIAGCLWLSVWFARRGKLIRSIFAGFIPVLLLFSVVLMVNA
jgi:hypothetical protein